MCLRVRSAGIWSYSNVSLFEFIVEEAGGKALPCILDVRDEQQVKSAVKAAVEKVNTFDPFHANDTNHNYDSPFNSQFGGIDILVNNASAISLTPTLETEMKRYDLMNNINTRGTFLV